MIPLDVAWVFFAASVALALAPGPDNIFVLTQSAQHGPVAGLLVTLGLCTGLVFHTAAVGLGVAALLAASELAFNALKILGAAYLLYLAWQAFRAGAAPPDSRREQRLPARALYVRGVIMNISNPKVAIFFLAFLPQFAEPARGPVVWQIAILGLIFMVAALLIFGAIAAFAGAIGARLWRSPAARNTINRIAGLVFVALALRLVLAQR